MTSEISDFTYKREHKEIHAKIEHKCDFTAFVEHTKIIINHCKNTNWTENNVDDLEFGYSILRKFVNYMYRYQFGYIGREIWKYSHPILRYVFNNVDSRILSNHIQTLGYVGCRDLLRKYCMCIGEIFKNFEDKNFDDIAINNHKDDYLIYSLIYCIKKSQGCYRIFEQSNSKFVENIYDDKRFYSSNDNALFYYIYILYLTQSTKKIVVNLYNHQTVKSLIFHSSHNTMKITYNDNTYEIIENYF